jgi:hypothetical protein
MGFVLFFTLALHPEVQAFTLNVVDGNNNPIPAGYHWLLEEDTTNVTVPGAQVSNSIGLSIHKSHAPVVTKGHAAGTPATVTVPSDKRYFVSVLPDSDYSLGGAVVEVKASSVTVIVQKLPLPTAQISILAFVDQGPVNNGFDEGEQGLGGCTVQLFDVAGGPITQDAFGNRLGTRYVMTCDATGQNPGTGTNPCADPDTAYLIEQEGTGFVFTLTKEEFNAALGLDVNGNPLPGGPDPSKNPYNLKVGEALVKYLAPGKYGVILVPPNIDDNGNPIGWVQTTTIEGTPTIDAWVKANEPTLFIEGFGTGFKHTVFGFVRDPAIGPEVSTCKGQTFEKPPWNKTPPEDLPPGPYGTIRGTLRANHFARPPLTQGFHAGEPVSECWVGLNDPNIARETPLPGGGETFSKNGRYITPCNENSEFVIPNVPPGTYQLVWWDRPLDYLFGFQSVTIPPGGGDVNLGDVLAFRWFGTLQGSVFYDENENGFRDPDEVGIQSQTGNFNQVLNLRFRDGTIYQTTVTDPNGEYEFPEVFPFFKWLVAEVGFTNFKATGMTAVVDEGGAVPPHAQTSPNPPKIISTTPSFDKLKPQPQVRPPSWRGNGPPSTAPVNNPNTGNNLSRTDTGPILLQAMHLFLNQTNVIDWGKRNYAPGDVDNPPLGNFPGSEDVDHNDNGIFDFGENGGISGVVFYATTRAENDPKEAVGDGWEPGVPRVQVNLYLDNVNNSTGLAGPDGIPDDLNGDGQVTLADADNYPFAGRRGGTPFRGRPGPGDVDRDGRKGFNSGDAISITWTDSWDDNPPTGCIQPLPIVHGRPIPECADTFATWNQVRDGVFDGGYAFTSYFVNGAGNPVPFRTRGGIERALPPGTYIVEVMVPPGYELVKEEDKNVDLGDSYIPGLLVTPPPCVNWDDVDGDGNPGRVVPQYLSMQTDENGIPLPGILPDALIPAPFAGESRPLCDRKQVTLTEGQNAAADFHVFTHVPKAARAVGFANNDLAAEFNVLSPNFGEKLAPAWIPVSFRDWTGKEIVRIYTDEFGHYNALLPSTYTVNVPSPSGVSPHMMTLVLNHPTKADGTPDPFYNPTYSVTPWTFQYYPGSVTYLDTPLVPLAAFSPAGVALDTNPPTGTPGISTVNGPEPNGGPFVCSAQPNGGNITITSVGTVQVPNPNYNPALRRGRRNPFLINRDYGFGNTQGSGSATLGGVPLAIVSWDNNAIVATVPPGATGGRLMVTRSNGASTEIGVVLNVVDCATTTVIHVPANQPTIQAAIDAATAGSLILVAPGTYNENVIMYKPVFLQGAGAGSTFINADPNPLDRLQAWHNRIELEPPAGLGGAAYQAFLLKNVFFQNEAPGISVIGELTHDGGNTQFPDPANPHILNPGNPFPAVPGPAGINARINGFTIFGSKAGGGITAFAAARHVEISDNRFTNNQGNDAGGVGIGISDVGFDQQNINVVIRRNKFDKNGGVQGPGAIGVNESSNDYLIEDNLIVGNFSRFNGGAIAHRGLILGTGIIRGNKILFNECHFGALLNQAGDGGAIYIAGDIAGGTGSGNVTIDSNLIQGNMTGSGYGGGIRAFAVNGLEVSANPNNTPPVDPQDDPPQWFELKITNNIIVNNVAGLAGGGIALQDVARASIINNTIANNDSTATAALAFTAGQLNSNPQPAGIVSGLHTPVLQGFFGVGLEQTFSNPLLVNNIIWHNRSFFNLVTAGVGSLAPWDPDNDPATPNNPYWDLSVLGSVSPADPHLTPANCILTQELDPKTGFDYGAPPANRYGDEAPPIDPLFVSEYFNQLQSAAVLDEGGNFINVLIKPLVPTGNYHIRAPRLLSPGSPAIDAGVDTYIAQFPELLGTDFDGEVRPNGGGVSDIGADELQ